MLYFYEVWWYTAFNVANFPLAKTYTRMFIEHQYDNQQSATSSGPSSIKSVRFLSCYTLLVECVDAFSLFPFDEFLIKISKKPNPTYIHSVHQKTREQIHKVIASLVLSLHGIIDIILIMLYESLEKKTHTSFLISQS